MKELRVKSIESDLVCLTFGLTIVNRNSMFFISAKIFCKSLKKFVANSS